MDSCLLCLQINLDLEKCIRADSKRWQDLDISNIIEKHFWSLNTIQCNSWICTSCWQIAYDFHKFYLRIEESHMKLLVKLEKEDSNELHAKKTGFAQNFNDSDVDVKNEPIESDGTVSAFSLEQLDKSQIESCQLDKMKNSTVDKFRKRKQSEEDTSGLNSTAEGSKKKRVDLNDSESATNSDYDDTDINSLSDTNTSEDDEIYYEKDLLSREKNDKIIEDYFKQISCDVCNMPLENFFSVLKHFFEAHQQKGYIRCCKKQFFNRSDLVEHISCHSFIFEKHKLHAHNAEEISKKYSSDAPNLKIQKSTRLPEEGKTFLCQDCNKSKRKTLIPTTSPNFNKSHQTFDLKTYLDEMFNVQMEKIGQQNRKIMEALESQSALTKMLVKQDEAASNLAKLFPINSEESLIELEKQIEENSKDVYLVAIKDIIRKNICKNIGLVISEDLLYTFNTDGTHGKKRLKDFASFYDVLKEAVKADTTVDDVEGAIRKAISLIKKRHLKKY